MNTASLFKLSEHCCQYTITGSDTIHLNSELLKNFTNLCLFWGYMCNYLQARLIIRTLKLIIYFYCGRLETTKYFAYLTILKHSALHGSKIQWVPPTANLLN